MIASKKPPKSKKQKMVVPQATFISASPNSYSIPIESFGSVESYDETTLVSEVNAKVIHVAREFREGLNVKKGDTLIRLEDIQIKAQLQTAKANVIIAQSALDEETVLSNQAKEDWLSSGRSLDSASSFVLREPQVAAAQASLSSAQATVLEVSQDLDKTVIKAPYDALVLEQNVSLGDFANATTILGRLVSLDKVQVRLPLTSSQMTAWNQRTDSTPNVTLTSPALPDVQWNAKITRAAPVIDSQNQTAFVIAEVDSPYSQPTPLTIGTFVNVEIPTPPINNLYKVPETTLVNNSTVWLISKDDTLFSFPAQKSGSYKGENYIAILDTDEELEKPLRLVIRPLTTFRTGNKVNPVESLSN